VVSSPPQSEFGLVRGVAPLSVLSFCRKLALLMTGWARPPWNQTPLAATRSRRILHRLHRQRALACWHQHTRTQHRYYTC